MLAEEMLAKELERVGVRTSGGEPRLDYSIDDVRLRTGTLDMRLTQGERSARLEVELPPSGRQPWLYAEPSDSTDWIAQFLVWLDEEMFTDGLGSSRAREERRGESYVIVEPYGWRVADIARHEHLRTLQLGGSGL